VGVGEDAEVHPIMPPNAIKSVAPGLLQFSVAAMLRLTQQLPDPRFKVASCSTCGIMSASG
jgi:hypothetical protein